MKNIQTPKPSNRAKQKVLVTTSYFEPAHLGGGPIQTLKALTKAAPKNFDTRVICLNQDLGEKMPLMDNPNTWIHRENAEVKYVQGGIAKLIEAFSSAKDVDILYLNSFFNLKFTLIPLALWKMGLWKNSKVLLAPRGEFDPGALALKPIKKRAFISLFKVTRLPRKIVWHASTELEADNIRKALGPNIKVVTRENETSLPMFANQIDRESADRFRLIFASRLHEKKGLHILLSALSQVPAQIDLHIVGAFADKSYEDTCHRLANQLPNNIMATFHGGLPRDEVLRLFSQSDLFAFPTSGENFGHVIAEALSQSCPVMCSTMTPWNEVLQLGGGVVVDNQTPTTWAASLNEFITSHSQFPHLARSQAAASFNQWRNASQDDHVFELLSRD